MKYIQLIGTQRSGSNLFRLMLNQLDEIHAPHPPHILSTFYPILDRYGDLNIKSNLDRLLLDVIEWVKLNPIKWKNFLISPDKIFSRISDPSIFQIFRSIYVLCAEQSKSSFWLCKSLSNMNYYKMLEKEALDPIYVYLYRDGRDVALSFKKTIVGPKHSYFIAKKWKEEQILCDKIKNEIPKERFISIRYEDLLSNPEEILSDFCKKININYNKRVMKYYKSEESKTAASSGDMWSNLSKPLIVNNKAKFVKELRLKDLLIIESIASDILLKLDYEIYNKGDECISNFSDDEIDEFKILDSTLRSSVIKKAKIKDLDLRKPQENLLKSILRTKLF